MTEIKTVSAETAQRVGADRVEDINIISNIIEQDMMRYDRTLDAEEEIDEY